MSQHYLLDGYNIIKQTSSLNQGTLESQRLALVRWIEITSPQGSAHNSVMVVFDGKEEFFGSSSSGNVKVVFSQGQSADDLIKKIVEQYPSKKSIVVVSNDKDITLYVRALGASVLSVKEFIGTAAKKSRPLSNEQKSSQAASSKYVSLTDQAKINKELEQIWIKTPKQ
jgi:predicted RNA-binding protein with PIN domain